MTFPEFADAVHQVQHALLDEFESNPLTAQPSAPKDFQAMLSTLRRVAEELILCADVSGAIARLRQDQTGELAAVLFLSLDMLPADCHVTAIKRAHASTLHEPIVLPFHAFGSYLIELADGLEVVKRPPET